MIGNDFRSVVEDWIRGSGFRGRALDVRILPAREAQYGDLDPPLHPSLAEQLGHKGITRLYSHQARAVDLVRSGNHTVIVSGTASGKTLCYQIPIAEAGLADRAATSLLIFPTKALAQDQLGSIRALKLPNMVVSTYDGDVPRSERSQVRKRANVILTNPDMLHYGILPNHRLWGNFLSRLSHVVIDEMHYLRGIFGSHTAHIIRRLRRLAQSYGADPTLVLTSATIGNPTELAQDLCGSAVSLVDEDGSPAGERLVVVWDPPLENGKRGGRRSPIAETVDLYVDLVRRGVKTIAFGRSRRATELIHIQAAERLGRRSKNISPYRGGYTPADRRDIEEKLFSGKLTGISATNALELGVDIGGLDAALLCTFPGTIASFRQQSGRAGRASDMSLVVLVPGQDALDRYFTHYPDELFNRPPEAAVVNPSNPSILDHHLACAAHEAPLEQSDQSFFGEDLWESTARLVGEGRLQFAGERLAWSGRRSPAHGRSLRSSDARVFSVFDIEARRPLGVIDWERAFWEAHDGAIYLHKGRTYLVESIDPRRLEIRVRQAYTDYYTEPRVDKNLSVLEVIKERKLGYLDSFLGSVVVSSHVMGYRKTYRRTKGDKNRIIPLDHPPTEITTESFWLTFAPGVLDRADIDERQIPSALHAAEHAMIAMMPLFAICDRSDIGGLSTRYHAHSGQATIFLHEGYEGGAGIAAVAFPDAEKLVRATIAALSRCPCASGCPSCVQSPKCGNFNEYLSKSGAKRLLTAAVP